ASCSLLCLRHHLVLHPFPTRRSSDLAFALLFGANHAYVLGLPMLLTQELSAPAQVAGWLMGTAAAIEIPVMLLAGWLAARLKLRSEEHTSELQSRENLVCRLLLEKKH